MTRARRESVKVASEGGYIVAPILGAVGGTVVVTIAVEKFKLKRPVAAFGTAAASLIAARNATGAARAAFEAAAIAGVCIGVTELLARLRQRNVQPQPLPAMREAAPPDAVTPTEFREALATIQAKHQTEIARREEEHRATLHSLLKQMRDAQSTKANRAPVVDIASKPARVRVVDTSSVPHDSAGLAERMAAIYPLLDESERRHWSTMVATMPKEELLHIQRELMQGTPLDAVAFLRSSVFRTPIRLPS